jgi:hypothetical protein
MSTSPQYEFSQQQNSVIGALANRMGGVGLFLVIVAILDLLVSLLLIVTIYRAKLPQDYVDKVLEKTSEVAKTDVKAQLSNIPPDNHLWGAAIGSAVNGLIYLLIGVWTRRSAGSFKKIVDTRGSDITHLMNALSELNKMYTLLYTLIIIGLLVLGAAAALFLYAQFAR